MSKILAASAVLLLSGAALLAEQDQAAQTKATAKLQLVQCAIRVYDMTCNSCAASVQKELLKVEGVKAVKMELKTGEVQVEYDPQKTTPEKVVAVFNKADPGYRAELPRPKGK